MTIDFFISLRLNENSFLSTLVGREFENEF